MNNVKDLRVALADEVRRLQPPPGLESRILQQALRGSAARPSGGAAGNGSIRSWKSLRPARLTTGARALGVLAAVLVVVLIVVGILVGERLLRDWGSIPAGPPIHAVPRADSGMVTSTTGWRSGSGHPLQRTTDGGLHWTDVGPASVASPDAAYFLDANHAWVTTQDANGQTLITYRTFDGGKTWVRGMDVTVVAARCNGCLQPRLHFLDPAHGWLLFRIVTTDTPTNMVEDALYGTSDSGLHWAALATDDRHPEFTGCDWGGTSFASPQNGWLTESCASAPLLVTHDGGVTWAPQELPLAAAGLTCPCSVDRLTVFDQSRAAILAYGQAGPTVLLTTRDAGNNWNTRTLPGESAAYGYAVQYIVDFSDADHGWTVWGPSALFFAKSPSNPNGIVPGTNVPLDRTDDGGLTWVAVKTDLPFADESGRVIDLYFVDTQHGFAVRSNGDGPSQFLKTEDGGRHWAVVR